MKRNSGTVTVEVSAKKSKKNKKSADDTKKSNDFEDLFAGLNYTLQKASTSKTSEDVARKFDKFSNDFEFLQNKLSRMEKENSIMFSVVEKILEAGEVSCSEVTLPSSEYCNFCNLTLANRRYFYAHMIDRHVLYQHRYVACVLCNARCEDMDSFDRHLLSHSKESTCKICNDNTSNLLDHIIAIHGYDHSCYLQLGCDFCSYRTNNCTSLQLHCFLCSNNPSNSNYRPTEEGRVCNLCHQVFNTNLQMLRHKETKHAHGHDGKDLKTYVCEECGQSFFSVRSLGGHKRKHSKKKGALEGMSSARSTVSDDVTTAHRTFEPHELEDMPDF